MNLTWPALVAALNRLGHDSPKAAPGMSARVVSRLITEGATPTEVGTDTQDAQHSGAPPNTACETNACPRE